MDREHEIYKTTLIGSIGNILLMIFKFIAGLLGHSSAMIADAFHSLSDLVTDVVVLLFVKISSKPQDENHKYGHGKFETIATFLIGLALIAVAIGIIVSGCQQFVLWLNGGDIPAPEPIALWAALVSIVTKEILFRITLRKGRQIDSQVMIANAWHHRSDALSSIGATIGIGGAILLGDRWTVLDPLMGIVVGTMLIKVAVDLLRNSVDELTEAALPPEKEQEIIAVILSHPEVCEPHNLRTRRIGNRIAIEAHIRMNGNLTLNEAHERTSEIEKDLRDHFGKNALITLHVEPTKER